MMMGIFSYYITSTVRMAAALAKLNPFSGQFYLISDRDQQALVFFQHQQD